MVCPAMLYFVYYLMNYIFITLSLSINQNRSEPTNFIHRQSSSAQNQMPDKVRRTTPTSTANSTKSAEEIGKPRLSISGHKQQHHQLVKQRTTTTPPMQTQMPATDALKPSEASTVVMQRFAASILQKGVVGLVKEFDEIQQFSKVPAHQHYTTNMQRNRYCDIFCADSTRVVLNWPPGSTNDYIHANWIKGFPELNGKEMIATQAPTENTIRDFWRMVWQEKVSVVMMLCQLEEGGKKKADLYWPYAAGDIKNFNDMQLKVFNMAVEEDAAKQLRITTICVKGVSTRTGEQRDHQLTHMMWRGWPDKDVPASSVQPIQMINKVAKCTGVVVVHCSAGIGRTGTIIGLEIGLRTLLAGRELSVWNVIRRLREMRYKSCQTPCQYLYIHYALLSYLALKGVVKNEEINKFQEQYLHAVAANASRKNKPIKTN